MSVLLCQSGWNTVRLSILSVIFPVKYGFSISSSCQMNVDALWMWVGPLYPCPWCRILLEMLAHLGACLSFDRGAILFLSHCPPLAWMLATELVWCQMMDKTLSRQLHLTQLLPCICLYHACFPPKLHLSWKQLCVLTLSAGQRAPFETWGTIYLLTSSW